MVRDRKFYYRGMKSSNVCMYAHNQLFGEYKIVDFVKCISMTKYDMISREHRKITTMKDNGKHKHFVKLTTVGSGSRCPKKRAK